MDSNEVYKFIMQGISLLFVLFGGFWTYVKFVVERGLLPPSEFTFECNEVGSQKGFRLVEILLHLRNKGTSTLVITGMQARIRYLKDVDSLKIVEKLEHKAFGRANMLHSVSKDTPSIGKGPAMIEVAPNRTFVLPGVNQVYTLITAVPDNATFLVVKGQFAYALCPSLLQRTALKIGRFFGLLQYSLIDVTKPHTFERAFRLGKA